MKPPARRLPWEPVQARLDAVLAEFCDGTSTAATESWLPTSRVALADRLAVTRRTIERYVVDGVPVRMTDDIACAVGRLPYELWPDRVCGAHHCNERFVPPSNNPHKWFCSARCKSREGARRRYRSNPDRTRERVAVYDALHRDEKRQYSRDYYRRNRDRLLLEQRARDRRVAA